jgi:hypothetical protein
VDDPKLFLASLKSVASQLGQAPDQVWTTVCASGNSAVKRLVDDPKLFMASLQSVASQLGQAPDQVWTTVCASGGSAVKRLVDDHKHFVNALNVVADKINLSAWEVLCLYAGCSDSLWGQFIDEAESVGVILSETSQDNYALVKLNGTAEKNFWRNTEVRRAAQAQLALNTPWAKIKAILSSHGVDTAEKFNTALSNLTVKETPQIYAKRVSKTLRRHSDQIAKKHKCDVCGTGYGTKKALRLHIKKKHR